ncbi:MAG: TadE/TadG family type IV pilus assembly protein [Solirubrobacteraceae bacterium]
MDACASVRGSARPKAPARGREDGQALIEFAFVAPLLLVILFAIFDLGQALNYQNDETNLANVVARFATVIGNASSVPACGGATQADAFLFVKCEAQLDSAGLANSIGVCVTDETSAGSYAASDALQVTLYYPFKFLYIIGSSTITLSSSATMMLEASVPNVAPTTTEYAWLNSTNSDGSNPANTNPGHEFGSTAPC